MLRHGSASHAHIRKWISAAACAGLLSACAVPQYYVSPNHPRGSLEDRSLYLRPVSENDIQNNLLDHFKDDFKPTSDANGGKILADAFNARFAGKFRKASRRIAVTDSPMVLPVVGGITVKRTIGEGEGFRMLEFEVPGRETLLERNIDADFILLTQGLVFDIHIENNGFASQPATIVHTPAGSMQMGGGVGGSSQSRLIQLELQYLIWDYARKEIAAMGIVRGYASAQWYITQRDWFDIMDNAAENLLARPPFRAPSTAPTLSY